MPLPFGARYVNSQRKSDGIILADGTQVTRSQGENLGSQQLGYRNQKDYARNKGSAETIVSRVLNSRQGKRDYERARAIAKSRGERFDARAYRKLVLSIRNAPRDARGDVIDRGPGSPMDRWHKAVTTTSGPKYNAWIRGEDSP
jgi:hypothetical protein